MRDCRHDSHRSRRLGCLLPAVAAVLLAIGAAAQETEGQSPPPSLVGRPMSFMRRPVAETSQPADARVATIIGVKYTNAAALAQTLSILQISCRVAADDRTNTLIVDGFAGDVDTLRKLIAQLDVPQSAVKPAGFQIYKLSNRPANDDMMRILSTMLGRGGAVIVTDQPRNLVLVSGNQEAQALTEMLLKALDTPLPAPPSQTAKSNMKVRIVWLMAGPKTDSLPEAPADLKDVVEELTGIGVPQPRMAAQFVIQTNTEEGFEMSAPVVFLQPTRLEITGTYSDWPSDKPTLNLKIVAAKLGQEDPHAPTDRTSGGGGMGGGMGATPREELWSIKTTMSAPVGHAVVLGVSPTGSTTSAFVVQVLPK